MIDNTEIFLWVAFYIIPLIICLAIFTIGCIEVYKDDVKNSLKEDYVPYLTIGKVLILVLTAIIPIINLIIAVFYIIRTPIVSKDSK